ncbi:MAG TPA: hypothetical protein VFO98_01810 [Marmoricola sp.]|jgi:hypothetical protein|nr:hypothetical protein [Marmoricola sp.]
MGRTLRGIFFDADTAEVVRTLLVSDGYAAELVQERFAGEDDDEDHAWAVVTDAPAMALELLVDAYDGWLDDDQLEEGPAAPSAAPSELPATPRRRHRPD